MKVNQPIYIMLTADEIMTLSQDTDTHLENGGSARLKKQKECDDDGMQATFTHARNHLLCDYQPDSPGSFQNDAPVLQPPKSNDAKS